MCCDCLEGGGVMTTDRKAAISETTKVSMTLASLLMLIVILWKAFQLVAAVQAIPAMMEQHCKGDWSVHNEAMSWAKFQDLNAGTGVKAPDAYRVKRMAED
jgi:hypothetical protein